jgi:predicted  nucleic acid-binding Zn-ribbon protein
VTLQGAARMGAAKAKSAVNEVARLRTRIQELEAEVHQLNHEKLALQSEVDELRARVSARRAASPIAPRRRANDATR